MQELTVDPTVHAIVQTLRDAVQHVLGVQIVGIYLDGSLANGDFDAASDIDFIVVTESEITPEVFSALHAMHAAIAASDSPWALQLEGSYISREALRRYNPQLATHPNIERGPGEQLKMAFHDVDWLIHRWVLRERGIVVVGPAPATLVDPVTSDELRQAMRSLLQGWFSYLLTEPTRVRTTGYLSYLVLSLCRILYTITHGAIVSKAAAASWAKQELDPQWHALIDHAIATRLDATINGLPGDPQPTMQFIRYIVATGLAAQPGQS